jgi:hypothetical protein
MPQRRYRIVAKYTKEARGCYGVCCPIVAGEEKPQFMKTWDYTERTLVSLKVWKQHANAEMTYRRGSKYKGWALFNGEYPYQERFGDNWESKSEFTENMRKIRYETTICLHITMCSTYYFIDFLHRNIP